MPEGFLTPTQHEIMQIVWSNGRCGVSVGEIWKEVSQNRKVARTTILKLVERLEAREWLARQAPRPKQKGSAMRFAPTIGRRKARAKILQQFVNDYYEGSAAELAKSLLLWKCVTKGQMGEIKEMINHRLKS